MRRRRRRRMSIQAIVIAMTDVVGARSAGNGMRVTLVVNFRVIVLAMERIGTSVEISIGKRQ